MISIVNLPLLQDFVLFDRGFFTIKSHCDNDNTIKYFRKSIDFDDMTNITVDAMMMHDILNSYNETSFS